MKFVSRAFLCVLSLSACVPLGETPLEDYRKALEQIDVGVAKLHTGELEDAKAAFTVSLDLNRSAVAYDGLGCVSLMKGDLDEAEELLWTAYNMDDRYDHVLGNLAMLYEMRGDAKQALVFHQAAVERNPEQFRFRNNYGAYLWDYEARDGDPRRALAELRKAKSLSNDELIQQNIVRLEEVEHHGRR